MGGGGIWAFKTRLAPPITIEVPVHSQESEQSCICVKGIDLAS